MTDQEVDIRASCHVTSRRQDQYMCLTNLRNQVRTAVETALVTPGTHNNQLSPDIVRNRREFGLWPCRPYVCMQLTPQRRQVRLNWVTQYRPNLFPLCLWSNVMFSDRAGTSTRAPGYNYIVTY